MFSCFSRDHNPPKQKKSHLSKPRTVPSSSIIHINIRSAHRAVDQSLDLSKKTEHKVYTNLKQTTKQCEPELPKINEKPELPEIDDCINDDDDVGHVVKVKDFADNSKMRELFNVFSKESYEVDDNSDFQCRNSITSFGATCELQSKVQKLQTTNIENDVPQKLSSLEEMSWDSGSKNQSSQEKQLEKEYQERKRQKEEENKRQKMLEYEQDQKKQERQKGNQCQEEQKKQVENNEQKDRQNEENYQIHRKISNIFDPHLDIGQQFSRNLIQGRLRQAMTLFKKMSPIQKNSPDCNNSTPLYLTTLLSIRNQKFYLETLKQLLRDKEINPTQKTPFQSKPIQQAILYRQKSIPVLTHIFRVTHLYRIREIKESLKAVAGLLDKIPDLFIKLYIKVGSFLPFVERLTPDDTITIFKKGQKLRIDYSLIGYSFLQSKRRQMSCSIQKLGTGDYTVLGINHQKKCYTDLIQPLQDQQFVLMIQDMLNNEIKRINPQILETSIKKDLNIFRETMREETVCGIATKYQIMVLYMSDTQKLRPNSLDVVKDLGFLDDWDHYQKNKPVYEGRKKQKQFKLAVWQCQKAPLSLDQLLQIMNILSYAHESGQIIHSFLSEQSLQSKLKGFPMKIQIPINFTLYLDITVEQLSMEVPDIEFEYMNKYRREKRSTYQKTLVRREKRQALLRMYL